jgi:hypothetical protein
MIWGLFWLIERLYGVSVKISGWSLFLPGFKTLTLKTAHLELVSVYCTCRLNIYAMRRVSKRLPCFGIRIFFTLQYYPKGVVRTDLPGWCNYRWVGKPSGLLSMVQWEGGK